MTEKEAEAILLEKAQIQEKEYNFFESARLYEKVGKSFLDSSLIEEAAKYFHKAGLVSIDAIETVESSEEFIENIERGIKDYTLAKELFLRFKRRSLALECEAEVGFIKAYMNDSAPEIKKALNDSYDLFLDVNELYRQEGNTYSLIRTLLLTLMVLTENVYYCNSHSEIVETIKKGFATGEELWELRTEVKDLGYLGICLFYESFLNSYHLLVSEFQKDIFFYKNLKNHLQKFDDTLEIIDGWNDSRNLGYLFLMGAGVYCAYANHFIDDEIEQGKIFDKGFGFYEKAIIYAGKAKNNLVKINSIFFLNWWAFFGRRFKYVQKRIVKDIDELIAIGDVYLKFQLLHFMANLLPAFYYANISQMSMFSPDQRRTFAKKGIEHGEKALEGFYDLPFSIWSYIMVIYSLSQLAILSSSREEQKDYCDKMLYYIQEAKKNIINMEGGLSKAFYYSSVYRTYKTLADLTEEKENKIDWLSTAAEASENYLQFSMESTTGNLSNQMRLGLLKEELSILTGKEDHLSKAKNLFISIVKESYERGFYYFTAASSEYLARIEDRLGNYSASAEHYKRASKAHKDSLSMVKYKPRIKRINEKIEYVQAWSLIEEARTYHQRENHLRAKEIFQEACEILQKLKSYNYESVYYSAWVLLEEAEHLSKQEKHEEAIQAYNTTIENFDNTSVTLKKVIEQSRDRLEREKVGKLNKLIKIRIKHCSARVNVEEARILGRQGEHLAAAEKFALAASEFKEVCNQFKIEKEREELEGGYYLCRAWENMEFAETYGDSNRFAEAAGLFSKASNLFSSSKMKLLSSGNSAFCQALEYGCQFDETTDTKLKAKLYPKVKTILRKAASSYRKGGFENGADWALATSTYFDAAWHLIRADEEVNLNKKKQLLELGSKILDSASELFAKSGYKEKEREILDQLDMVKKEEKIIISALNTIAEPSIARSTIGIIAPACPHESSQSPRISEVRKFGDEIAKAKIKEPSREKYQLIYKDLLKEYPENQQQKFRVGIAQIGLSSTDNILDEFYILDGSGLLHLRKDKVDTISEKVKDVISNAQKNQINVLIFPEMSIDLTYGRLIEEISNLAKKFNMYIIPGSYHEGSTRRNLCMVISPDGVLWEQEKNIPATINFKGTIFKEGIDSGRFPRKITICNTEYGRIAIAICRDFLDMDLRVELKNFEPPVDLIINPAFTPVTADFKAAHFDARRSIYAYCFFANIGEYGNSLIYTPEKERIERTLPPKEEGLIFKDIDLFKLRSERKKWEKIHEKEKKFIQSTR